MSMKMARKKSIFNRYMRAPIRVLARARALYVKSLTGCGSHVSYGNAMGCPTPQIPSLPKNFSVNSTHSNYRTAEDELGDLMRLPSTRRLTGKIDGELRRSKSSMPLGGGGAVASVPRSHTVGFGRIDEDEPYDFGEEDYFGLLGGHVCQRSRSYALSK